VIKFQGTVQGRARHTQQLSHLRHALLGVLKQPLRGSKRLSVQHPRPTTPPPPRSSSSETRKGPLADELPLELREGAEDMKHQLPTDAAGVEILREALESDTSRVEVLDEANKVLEVPTEAIESPHYESVPLPEGRSSVVPAGSVGCGSTDAILEHSIATGFLQRIPLELKALFVSAHSSVADDHERVSDNLMSMGLSYVDL
jgi:hypothetical protein